MTNFAVPSKPLAFSSSAATAASTTLLILDLLFSCLELDGRESYMVSMLAPVPHFHRAVATVLLLGLAGSSYAWQAPGLPVHQIPVQGVAPQENSPENESD